MCVYVYIRRADGYSREGQPSNTRALLPRARHLSAPSLRRSTRRPRLPTHCPAPPSASPPTDVPPDPALLRPSACCSPVKPRPAESLSRPHVHPAITRAHTIHRKCRKMISTVAQAVHGDTTRLRIRQPSLYSTVVTACGIVRSDCATMRWVERATAQEAG